MNPQTTRVERFLVAALKADAALAAIVGTRIYSYIAPQGATYPLVLVAPLAEELALGLGATQIMEMQTWVVKIIAQSNSMIGLETANDRINAVLHNASGTAGGGTILTCYRDRGMPPYAEDFEGKRINHMGSVFKILAQ